MFHIGGRWRRLFHPPLGVVALLIIGCAGVQTREPVMPDWVANPPDSDRAYMYFTGSGTSRNGDAAEAEQVARGAVIDEIMRYLGVTVTSETTAVAEGSLDSFQASIVQQLTSEASGKVAGLELSERWIDRRESGVTVYLLVRYSLEELAREKKRIADVLQEKTEAILGAERAASQFSREGRHFEAAAKAIEAATAAATSDLDIAELKFAENINRTKASLETINLTALGPTAETVVGQEFAEPLRIKVAAGPTPDSTGIPGVSLRVGYSELTDAGRKSTRYQVIRSDDEGIAEFVHPAPQFVGEEEVIVSLDLGTYLSALQDASDRDESGTKTDSVDALAQLVAGRRLVLIVRSVSLAKDIETGVVIADVDQDGTLIDGSRAADGLLAVLTAQEFRVSALALDQGVLMGDAAGVTKHIREQLGVEFEEEPESAPASAIQRVIYGVARIEESEQDGDVIIVKVSGSVRAVDLETETVLLVVERSKSAVGRSASAAVGTAFRKLGEDIGNEFANNLR